MILTTIVLLAIYGYKLHIFFNTTYTIDGDIILIKCGYVWYKPINIMEMKKISKSSNIISSPAASFDRMEIRYGKFDELIISPKTQN